MQKSKPKYACLLSKIVEVWIERFCVRYDWSSVSPVWYMCQQRTYQHNNILQMDIFIIIYSILITVILNAPKFLSERSKPQTHRIRNCNNQVSRHSYLPWYIGRHRGTQSNMDERIQLKHTAIAHAVTCTDDRNRIFEHIYNDINLHLIINNTKEVSNCR